MSGSQWATRGVAIGGVSVGVILAVLSALSPTDQATARGHLGLGTGSAPDGGVLVARAGGVTWASPAAAGATHGSGTLAARPASPGAGDTYAVTSGAASGDRYQCIVAGTWILVDYDAIGSFAPTLRWKLDESSGTTAVNSGSASSANLTISGTPAKRCAISPRVSGMAFDTSTRYATGYSTTPSSSSAFSTCVTLTAISRQGGFQPLLIRRNSNGEPYTWYLGLSGGAPTLLYRTAAAGSYASLTSSILAPLTTHHVAAVWASGVVTLYLNGVSVGTASPGSTLLWATSNSPAWWIGLTAAAEYAGAVIGEVQVYDGTALSAGDVAELAARSLGTYRGQ